MLDLDLAALVLMAAILEDMVDLGLVFHIFVEVAFGFFEVALAGGANGDDIQILLFRNANVRALMASVNTGFFSETTPAPQQAALFISTKSIPRA